jgi:hypothetical protein
MHSGITSKENLQIERSEERANRCATTFRLRLTCLKEQKLNSSARNLISFTIVATKDRSRVGEEMRWMIDRQSKARIMLWNQCSFSTSMARRIARPSASSGWRKDVHTFTAGHKELAIVITHHRPHPILCSVGNRAASIFTQTIPAEVESSEALMRQTPSTIHSPLYKCSVLLLWWS